MKKKFLAVLLVLVCGLMFAGCGNFVDEYTVRKDIKINNEATEVELSDFEKDYANKIKELNKMEVIVNYKRDTGEIEVMGEKSRTIVDIEVKLVIDNTDETNPMYGITINGKVESEVEGGPAGKVSLKASQYYKDEYVYIDMVMKEKHEIDDEKFEDSTTEKYKHKIVLGPNHTVDIPELGNINTDINGMLDEINELVKEIKNLKGAEIGKDKKGNLVLQTIELTESGKRNCTSRVVFMDGLPVYFGIKNSTDLDFGEAITEAGINCNKGTIKFPNLDSYEEKK